MHKTIKAPEGRQTDRHINKHTAARLRALSSSNNISEYNNKNNKNLQENTTMYK